MSIAYEGGCQCGAVRYRVQGEPTMVALCHCTMCRRATGAPAVGWAMFDADLVEFMHDRPADYASSPDARRGFCARCGTSLSFTADYLPGLIDLTLGSLDEPARLPPQFHYWEAERLPWLGIADGLPRHREFPPMAPEPA